MVKFVATVRDTKNTFIITIPKEVREASNVEVNKQYQFSIEEIQ